MWVANSHTNSVVALRLSLQVVPTPAWVVNSFGPFTVGNHPQAMAFDGSNMWIVNPGDGTITKLRVSDGTRSGGFTGLATSAVVFDGLDMWVPISSDMVAKL